ncbi:MAG: shikimate kinase, partial [Magnetococcales bacterium]|nr:shikimate kinase [Magnetococcales bacterium]
MKIIMIGARGAGKSNISRRLLAKIKWPVLSTDLLISYE